MYIVYIELTAKDITARNDARQQLWYGTYLLALELALEVSLLQLLELSLLLFSERVDVPSSRASAAVRVPLTIRSFTIAASLPLAFCASSAPATATAFSH